MPSVRRRRGRWVGSNDIPTAQHAVSKGVSLRRSRRVGRCSVGSGNVELVFERGEFFGVADRFESLPEVVSAEPDFDTTLLSRKCGLLLAVMAAHDCGMGPRRFNRSAAAVCDL